MSFHIYNVGKEYILYDSIYIKLNDSSHNCVTFGRWGIMTRDSSGLLGFYCLTWVTDTQHVCSVKIH